MEAAVGDVGRTDETGTGKRSTRRGRENQAKTQSTKLADVICTRSAYLHTGQSLMKNAARTGRIDDST